MRHNTTLRIAATTAMMVISLGLFAQGTNEQAATVTATASQGTPDSSYSYLRGKTLGKERETQYASFETLTTDEERAAFFSSTGIGSDSQFATLAHPDSDDPVVKQAASDRHDVIEQVHEAAKSSTSPDRSAIYASLPASSSLADRDVTTVKAQGMPTINYSYRIGADPATEREAFFAKLEAAQSDDERSALYASTTIGEGGQYADIAHPDSDNPVVKQAADERHAVIEQVHEQAKTANPADRASIYKDLPATGSLK